MKNGAYLVNLDDCRSIGTRWIVFYPNGNSVTKFDSFCVENISEEIKRFTGNNNITNIFRIQALTQYFSIGLIDV